MPRKKTGKTLTCQVCGKEFYRKLSEIKRTKYANVCSPTCQYEARVKKLVTRKDAWLNEKEFVKNFKLLIPIPPKCRCGKYDYRFKYQPFDSAPTVLARCNHCDYLRYFNPYNNTWSPYAIPYFIRDPPNLRDNYVAYDERVGGYATDHS